MAFLKKEIETISPRFSIVIEEFVANKPVLIATLPGKDPSLPSLVLNSHYDVVPVMEEHWTDAPAWEGTLLPNGRVYGRGAQDMKCVCVQYLVALRKLVNKHGDTFNERTLHLTYVPDEEIGGKDGSK